MRVHSGSFLLGMAVAGILPLFTRALRPLAVQITSAGLGLVEEAQRVAAEQAETVSDIMAEARAQRASSETPWVGNGQHEPRRRTARGRRRGAESVEQRTSSPAGQGMPDTRSA